MSDRDYSIDSKLLPVAAKGPTYASEVGCVTYWQMGFIDERKNSQYS